MSIPARWQHQQKAFEFIRSLWARKQNGGLLDMAMGCGKSRVAAELAVDEKAQQLLIVCPLRVVSVWEQQLARFAPGHFHVLALDDRVGSVKEKYRKAWELYNWSQDRHQPIAIVINYDSARVTPFGDWAARRIWSMTILDECVPAGTQISTPGGYRAIEELKLGDVVLGYDHAKQQVVETIVTNTFKGFNGRPRYQVGSTILTSEHPVWTKEKSYLPASQLKGKETIAYLMDRKLRMVPARISETTTQPGAILQPKMFRQMAYVAPGICQNTTDPTLQGNRTPEHVAVTGTSRCAGEAQSASSLRPQPREEPREPQKGGRSLACHGLSPTHRRQWGWADSAAEDLVCCASRLSHGVSSANPYAATQLESGSRNPRSQAGNRGGWTEPSLSTCEAGGSAESRNPHSSGMAATALHQQRNFTESLIGNSFHPNHYQVFNLETRTGNYFANDLLVHNCHRIKEPRGRTAMWAAKLGLVSHRRLGLTGTPMPHKPLDIWAQFRFLNPFHLERTYSEFRARYAIMGGYFNKVEVGWKNLDELKRRFRELAFRVDDSVLDLPPEMDETRTADMGAQGARIYREMEREMIAQIEDGTVTAANAPVRLLRLAQITGGALEDEAGNWRHFDHAKEDLLTELLEDLDEPVVVFCRFLADLEAVHRSAQKAGHESRELSGERHEEREWQQAAPDRYRVLAAQIQAGSVGIDLTRARIAIYYSLGYNLSDYLQSRARIRRPPQARPCVFYHLQIRNSIDEAILRAVHARRDLVESVLAELKSRRS